MASKRNTFTNFFLAFPGKRFAPHSIFFVFYNVFYFLPVLAIVWFNYSEGGTSAAADLDSTLTKRLAWVYVLGILAFLVGSKLSDLLAARDRAEGNHEGLRLFELTATFKSLCLGIVVIFLISKYFLIPLGVYSDYAFDTENMTSGIWSFSMFCSEALLFFSMIVLFSKARRNVTWFLLLSAVNGINLMHGTRIFFTIAGIAFFFYLYACGKLTLKVGIIGVVCFLLVGYAVFLSRSHIESDDQTYSFARLISPVMFESIFSQLSLIETVRHPELWNFWGAKYHFALDALYLTVPRFLSPDKDKLLYINRFTDLSPLGAFSGYAQGLIYFGIFYPCFYFFQGAMAGWLYRHAKGSQFWSMIYVYFVCDFLFRIMRDGYIIPVKMLFDSFVILACVVGLSSLKIPLNVITAAGSDTAISRPGVDQA